MPHLGHRGLNWILYFQQFKKCIFVPPLAGEFKGSNRGNNVKIKMQTADY